MSGVGGSGHRSPRQGRAARRCAKGGDALPVAAALFEGKALQPLLERGSLRCRGRSRGPRGRPSGKDRSFPRPQTTTAGVTSAQVWP